MEEHRSPCPPCLRGSIAPTARLRRASLLWPRSGLRPDLKLPRCRSHLRFLCWHEIEAKSSSGGVKCLDATRLECLLVGLFARVDVLLTEAKHPEDVRGELSGRREDRDACVLGTSDAAEVGAQGCPRTSEC